MGRTPTTSPINNIAALGPVTVRQRGIDGVRRFGEMYYEFAQTKKVRKEFGVSVEDSVEPLVATWHRNIKGEYHSFAYSPVGDNLHTLQVIRPGQLRVHYFGAGSILRGIATECFPIATEHPAFMAPGSLATRVALGEVSPIHLDSIEDVSQFVADAKTILIAQRIVPPVVPAMPNVA
jgi:hypothetical protein